MANMRADECPDRIARFHLRMPRAMEKYCGAHSPRIASVFNATLALMLDEATGWRNMTGDGVHWNRAIHTLAARAILAQL